MKNKFLIPNKYKRIGWIILIPTLLLGILFAPQIMEFEPDFLDFNLPAIFIDGFFEEKQFTGLVKNNILNEIFAVLMIVSSILVAFSKEKVEDEYISKIRLESLVWSVYANYIILLFSILFIFDISFMWVMIFNMFTVLLFFIIRFNWQISKLKRSTTYEE